MRLLDLSLRNFQGIKKLDIEANGSDISLYGTNATGKTTVGNAITWLLYDKPLTGEKGFSPKVIDENGEIVHNLVNSVEAVFSHELGMVKLKKELKENWTKKRGSKTASFTGNKLDHLIDGVPVKADEYASAVARYCDPEKAKILTNPFSSHRT